VVSFRDARAIRKNRGAGGYAIWNEERREKRERGLATPAGILLGTREESKEFSTRVVDFVAYLSKRQAKTQTLEKLYNFSFLDKRRGNG
jgi:hypothetical protein